MVGMDQKDSYAVTQRPRLSPTSAVAWSWLGLLVTLQFALCSFTWSSGPRCSVAGMHEKDSYAVAGIAPRAVFLLLAKMLGISAGMDQKDSCAVRLTPRSPSTFAGACAWLVLLVTLHPSLSSLR